MADVFAEEVQPGRFAYALCAQKSKYAAHAINSHDELVAKNIELNDVIDKAWNRSGKIDSCSFIPGALDAWRKPVRQFLPYDFSGNPSASTTQYCNGWNDCGGYWKNHVDDITKQRDELVAEVERMRESNKRMAASIWSNWRRCGVFSGNYDNQVEAFKEQYLCHPPKPFDAG